MKSKSNGTRVYDSPEFQQLVSRHRVWSLVLTAAILIIYFGFILVLAFDKELLAAKISEHLTVGIPIGIGVILAAWVLTGIYVWWANSYYDKTVSQIKGKMGA
jgi:uncharacterized membrane protein (DUF485 family)